MGTILCICIGEKVKGFLVICRMHSLIRCKGLHRFDYVEYGIPVVRDCWVCYVVVFAPTNPETTVELH